MKIYSLMLTKLKESFTLNIKPTHATAQQILTAEYAWPKKRMTELNTIWKGKSITLQLKIKLVKCLTWTVMTYGTEGWTLKTKQIKSAEMWFYRRMLRVS